VLKSDHNQQASFYAMLYDLIPDDHILKTINQAIDFSFINEQLEASYSRYYGRPAKEPEMMLKILILQYLYNLSDIRVIEEANINLAYKWFLGLNPEDKLPDPSLLAKFRVHRLKDYDLDEIITKIVEQCINKGIIKSTTISVDATHTAANTGKLLPERIMKRLAKKIFKKLTKEYGKIPEHINQEIPNYKAIEDPKEAKQTMKRYLETLIAQVRQIPNIPMTTETLDKAEQIISEEKFIIQKGQRSLVDEDARVGYKSKNENFFGYKTEFTMTTEERIITAVNIGSGEYTDGK
jgi:transposase